MDVRFIEWKMITEFILIDLYSQRNEVVHYVSDWSVDEILSWLRCYGSVKEPTPEHNIYIFSSVIGIGLYCPFYFDENLKLTIPTSGWYYS